MICFCVQRNDYSIAMNLLAGMVRGLIIHGHHESGSCGDAMPTLPNFDVLEIEAVYRHFSFRTRQHLACQSVLDIAAQHWLMCRGFQDILRACPELPSAPGTRKEPWAADGTVNLIASVEVALVGMSAWERYG